MSAVMKPQPSLFPDDNEAKWVAVSSKDARFDGQFVFAVIADHHVLRAVHIAAAFLFSNCRKRQSRQAIELVCAAIREILRRKIRK